MPTNINVILQAIAVVTNVNVPNAPQEVVFDFQNPTLPLTTGGSAAVFNPYVTANTGGGTNIALPGSPVFGIFVQNLGTGIVNIFAQITGFPPPQSIGIGPTGAVILFDPSETALGWTGLNLTAVASAQPCSVLVCL